MVRYGFASQHPTTSFIDVHLLTHPLPSTGMLFSCQSISPMVYASLLG